MGKTRPAGPATPEGIRGCRCPEHCRGRVRSCVRIRVPVRVCARACRRTSVLACACVEEGRRSRAPRGMDVLLAGSVVVSRHHSIRPLGQPAISTPCHLQVRVASAVSDEKQPRSFAEPSPSAVTYMSAGGHPVRVIAGSDDEAWQESNPLRPRPAPRKGLKCAQVASTLPRPPAPHLRVGSSDRPRPVLAWREAGQLGATAQSPAGRSAPRHRRGSSSRLSPELPEVTEVNFRNLEPGDTHFPPRRACDWSASSSGARRPSLSPPAHLCVCLFHGAVRLGLVRGGQGD